MMHAFVFRQVWDQELDVLSQEWADLCDFQHRPWSSRNSATQYSSVGENIFAGTGTRFASYGIHLKHLHF